ncbi:hypothetical protein Tco_1363426 [Tanacetum coccineum]
MGIAKASKGVKFGIVRLFVEQFDAVWFLPESAPIRTMLTPIDHASKKNKKKDLHPELPGPGDRIVDSPEGKSLSNSLAITVRYRRSQSQSFRNKLKRPGKNTSQCYTKPLDSLKNWNNRFFWVDERVFPTVVDWRINAPKDEMPVEGSYSVEDVAILNTQCTPIQKQPEPLLCFVGLSRRYFLGDDVYPTFLYDDDRDMDLFNLIKAPNPTKVKTGTHPRVAHEVPLLTATASRVIDMEDPATATESSGTPSTIEKSPLDFDNENPSQQITKSDGPEDQVQETVAPEILPPLPRGPLQKSSKGTTVAGDPDSEKSSSFTSLAGSPVPPGYFLELCHLPNDEFLSQYNINLARKVAMGSQLRLRAVDSKVQGLRNQTSNLKTLLEAEVDMKKSAEAKKYEDERVSSRCEEMDARLDALSIDFDEELYPHMLTAIAGRRWVIGHGLRLAVMKCAESTNIRQAFANVLIMASLHLESDTREDAPQWIRDLRPSSSQLKIPIYPEVRTPEDPWAVKEEVPLEDAIAANISGAEKKKKCRVVCRTHGIGSAHHARSDGIPVSVPTIVPQGLAILLTDAGTQT